MKKLLVAAAAFVAIGVSYAFAQQRANKTQIARDINIFNAIIKELNASYVDSLDSKKLVTEAIDAMLYQIDPYTEYYPDEDREELTSISSGRYGGIGAMIQRRGDSVIVSKPLFGTPAWESGLRHGDRIMAIDGADVSKIKETDKISKMLRGQPGTEVIVDIRRPFASDSIKKVTITRRAITTDPLPYYGVDSTGVGYIRLTTFNENSASEVKKALVEMKKNPSLKGVVLDLRSNGGGVLEGAVQIVGLFVPKGTEVVRTKGFEEKNTKIYKTTQPPVDTDLPLAVLTDGNTASASEIVAGALQDLDRAVVIGDRSYGKGLVQSSRPLPFNGILKLTVARYYIPSGRLIQAIDYSHRNPDGSPARIPDSLTTVWKTAHGRDVRDGGGITPDIILKDSTMTSLVYQVLAGQWAFDFANRFRAQNQTIPASWQIDDSVFNDFKAFLDPAKFKYDRMTDSGVDYLRKALKFEGYDNDSTIVAQLEALSSLLHHDLQHDLEFNKPELLRILDTEISERYYSEGENVRRSLRYDNELDTARAVLLDPARYKKILSK